VPALDGCFAQGETVEDVLSDARGAIASHLAALGEDGQLAPGESGILIATVTLPAA
jgi:predicted RNase H-like HicB family nuclease